jgi:hypothetical protein
MPNKAHLSCSVEHPETLPSISKLATVLRGQGKYNNVLSDQGKNEEAEEMYRQALRLSETVLGKEHPPTVMSIYNLAYMLSTQK